MRFCMFKRCALLLLLIISVLQFPGFMLARICSDDVFQRDPANGDYTMFGRDIAINEDGDLLFVLQKFRIYAFERNPADPYWYDEKFQTGYSRGSFNNQDWPFIASGRTLAYLDDMPGHTIRSGSIHVMRETSNNSLVWEDCVTSPDITAYCGTRFDLDLERQGDIFVMLCEVLNNSTLIIYKRDENMGNCTYNQLASLIVPGAQILSAEIPQAGYMQDSLLMAVSNGTVVSVIQFDEIDGFTPLHEFPVSDELTLWGDGYLYHGNFHLDGHSGRHIVAGITVYSRDDVANEWNDGVTLGDPCISSYCASALYRDTVVLAHKQIGFGKLDVYIQNSPVDPFVLARTINGNSANGFPSYLGWSLSLSQGDVTVVAAGGPVYARQGGEMLTSVVNGPNRCITQNSTGVCCEIPCLNGGIGVDETACDCGGTDHVKQTCDKPCLNGGISYMDDTNTAICNCTGTGFTVKGKICKSEVFECETYGSAVPCENGGDCSEVPYAGYDCNCTGTGYEGDTCSDKILYCNSSPCINGGVCSEKYPASVWCNCTYTGYEGDWCETEVDECSSDPCLNAGTCTDLFRKFDCNCTGTGFEGQTCSEDVDDCACSPCEHGGQCKDKGVDKFNCVCDEFWEGKTCSDNVNDCLLTVVECLNGGSCTDDPVNLGDIICNCDNASGAFTGKYCDIPIDKNTCNLFNPCLHGGVCSSDVSELSCDCSGTGYVGQFCDTLLSDSDCTSSPCLNGGFCDQFDATSDYTCDCDNTGFHGRRCSYEYCASDSIEPFCLNAGTCFEDVCTCPPDFTGSHCEERIASPGSAVAFSSSSSSDLQQVNPINEANFNYEIQANCGDTNKQEIVMIGMGAVCGMAVLNWLVLREFPCFKSNINPQPTKPQRVFFMLMFVMTIFDFLTDVGFADYVQNACESDLDDVNVFASVVGTLLGTSSLLNFLILMVLSHRDPTNSVRNHLKTYPFVTGLAVLVSCANLSAFLVLDSNLLGIKSLTGKFPGKLKNRIKLVAIGTGLFQNIPQFITQTIFVSETGVSNSVTLSSITFSGILLLVNLARAAMIASGLISHKKANKIYSVNLPEENPTPLRQ